MTDSGLTYYFSRDEFVRAWEAGAFDHRVELVNGEIWPVVIGDWHGETVMRMARLLPDTRVRITGATLPAVNSLPDPDCWVRRADTEPTARIGQRLHEWDPADVLLVVEVSDETILADLSIKAKLYGSAGYPIYWVVTPEMIYEHSEPKHDGYRKRIEYGRGDRISVPYADVELAVDDVIGPQE